MSRSVLAEPLDLLLSSAATCAGLYVLVCCQARGIPTEYLRLEQQQLMVDGTLRRIQLRILLPVDFSEAYVTAVRATADSCRIRKASVDAPDIEVIVVPTPSSAE